MFEEEDLEELYKKSDDKKEKKKSKKETKEIKENREKLLGKLIKLRNEAMQYRKDVWDTVAKRSWPYYWYGQKDDYTTNDVPTTRQANYIFSTVEGIIPKIFDKMPGWQILPRGEDDMKKAPLLDNILQYEWRRMDVDEKIIYSVKDMLVPGFGLLKPFWNADDDALDCMGVDPFNFWLTAGDNDIDKAQGVFERVFMNIDDAAATFDVPKKSFPEFNATDLDNVSTQDVTGSKTQYTNKTAIFEFRGRCGGEEMVVRFNDYMILQDDIEPYAHGMRPYVPFCNYRTGVVFYAKGEVFELESLQEELREMDAQMSRWRKSCVNPKKYVVKGGLDKTNMTRVKDPGINIIEENVQGAVRWEQPPIIGRDLYTMRAQVKEDMGLISGQAEISRGGTEKTVQTATGQEIISQAAESRNREKIRTLNRAIQRLLQQMYGLLAEFQDEKQVIKLLDSTDATIFKEYNKKDIEGNYDFIVDITESLSTTKEKKGRLALEAYAQFKGDQDFDQVELKKLVAKLAFQDIQGAALVKDLPQAVPEDVKAEVGAVQQENMMNNPAMMAAMAEAGGQAPSPNLMPGQEFNQVVNPNLAAMEGPPQFG